VTPLEGAWLKIERATVQFEELEADVAATPYDSGSITFASHFDPDTSTIEVTLENVPKLPLRWGVIAADVLNNLRTALNYVAWEAAVWDKARRGETGDPDDTTQFPISYKRWKGVSAGQIKDITDPTLRRMIEDCQPNSASALAEMGEPYLRTVSEEVTPVGVLPALMGHPLAKLAYLNNEDKHRVLLTLGGLSFGANQRTCIGINCRIVNYVSYALMPIQDGMKYAEIEVAPTGSGEPKVEINDKIGPPTGLFFTRDTGDPSDANSLLPIHISDLIQIRGFVAEVVREFEAALL
jgi:hypothetical protein